MSASWNLANEILTDFGRAKEGSGLWNMHAQKLSNILDKLTVAAESAMALRCAEHWPIGELGEELPNFRCSCGATLIGRGSDERIAAWKEHIRALAKPGQSALEARERLARLDEHFKLCREITHADDAGVRFLCYAGYPCKYACELKSPASEAAKL